MKNLIVASIFFIPFAISAQNKNLKVESNHSTVGFNISVAGFTKVTGKFTDFDILIDWNDNDNNFTRVSANIQVSSINTGIEDRDTHLQSSDFFDSEKYPVIKFQSSSIRRIDSLSFEAQGELSMHGITRDITLPFQIIKMDGNTFGIKSRTTLNRLDYEVGSGFKHTSIPNFLSNSIEVEIDLWTKKRKE